MLDYLATIQKALVPIAVAGALTVFGFIGITGDMTVKEALTLAVTAFLVWLTKNAAKRS